MSQDTDPNAFLDLLQEAVERRATDLHLDPLISGFQLRVRVDGILEVLRNVSSAEGDRLINQGKVAAGIDPSVVFSPRGLRRKFEIAGRMLDCRMTLVRCISGPKMAVRLLDPALVMQSVGALGFDEEGLKNVRRWLEKLNGMFLVSGPTASGKTTTLYALLHELAQSSRHVVTIEDPVEYEIDGINQIQVDQRHGVDFAEGVRTILRLDPDHAMIGEVREPAAANVAVGAAVAGHVVLTSLHARDAVSSITALRNLGTLDHQIAAALGVVVNQRLARVLCHECRERTPITPAQAEWFRIHAADPPAHAWRSRGCPECQGTGYRGRTGIFEVWNLMENDYEMILAGADEESIRDQLQTRHHKTIWHQAAARIEGGVTSLDEIRHLGLVLPWD